MPRKKAETKQEIIKEISKTEDSMVSYCNSKHEPIYRLTRERFTDKFILYKIVDDGFVKIGEGDTPGELERNYVKYK